MFALGIALEHAVPDRVHEVRLAQPHAAVQEQRVVRHRRRLGDRLRGGVREPVRVADDEIVERVARVQVADAQVVGGGGLRRRRDRGRRRLRLVAGIDDDAQRDLRAQQLVQHRRDVGLEPVLHPVARERGLHGEDDFGGGQIDQPHRLQPHLEDRFVVARLEQVERRGPEILWRSRCVLV